MSEHLKNPPGISCLFKHACHFLSQCTLVLWCISPFTGPIPLCHIGSPWCISLCLVLMKFYRYWSKEIDGNCVNIRPDIILFWLVDLRNGLILSSARVWFGFGPFHARGFILRSIVTNILLGKESSNHLQKMSGYFQNWDFSWDIIGKKCCRK